MLKRILFRLARSPLAGLFLGLVFERASRLIPVRRLYEDGQVMVFPHPAPYWDFHALAVPRRRVPTFLHLDLAGGPGPALAVGLVDAARRVAAENGLAAYTLLINGGSYQDVPQLHLHLAGGRAKDGRPWQLRGERPVTDPIDRCGTGVAYAHPNPARRRHELLVSEPMGTVPALHRLDLQDPRHAQALLSLLRLAQQRVRAEQLSAYAIAACALPDEDALCLHLLSGGEALPQPA